MSFEITDPHLYLKQALTRKKRENPLYSLRALSRDLGMSPSFLSKIFNGQKPLPEKYLKPICQRVGLDLREETALARAYGIKVLNTKTTERYGLLSFDRASIFTDWHFPAICDLTTCSDFVSDTGWIAKRLGISEKSAKAAIEILLRDEHLVLKNNILKKSRKKLRLPASKSTAVFRQFHQRWLQKTKDILETQTDQKSFERRLVHGITLAGNPEKLREAQQILADALCRASDLLTEGDCTEIYHLGAVQIQLSKPSEDI